MIRLRDRGSMVANPEAGLRILRRRRVHKHVESGVSLLVAVLVMWFLSRLSPYLGADRPVCLCKEESGARTYHTLLSFGMAFTLQAPLLVAGGWTKDARWRGGYGMARDQVVRLVGWLIAVAVLALLLTAVVFRWLTDRARWPLTDLPERLGLSFEESYRVIVGGSGVLVLMSLGCAIWEAVAVWCESRTLAALARPTGTPAPVPVEPGTGAWLPDGVPHAPAGDPAARTASSWYLHDQPPDGPADGGVR